MYLQHPALLRRRNQSVVFHIAQVVACWLVCPALPPPTSNPQPIPNTCRDSPERICIQGPPWFVIGQVQPHCLRTPPPMAVLLCDSQGEPGHVASLHFSFFFFYIFNSSHCLAFSSSPFQFSVIAVSGRGRGQVSVPHLLYRAGSRCSLEAHPYLDYFSSLQLSRFSPPCFLSHSDLSLVLLLTWNSTHKPCVFEVSDCSFSVNLSLFCFFMGEWLVQTK